jgi:hypothetical protein
VRHDVAGRVGGGRRRAPCHRQTGTWWPVGAGHPPPPRAVPLLRGAAVRRVIIERSRCRLYRCWMSDWWPAGQRRLPLSLLWLGGVLVSSTVLHIPSFRAPPSTSWTTIVSPVEPYRWPCPHSSCAVVVRSPTPVGPY